jgi:hypothetical protein
MENLQYLTDFCSRSSPKQPERKSLKLEPKTKPKKEPKESPKASKSSKKPATSAVSPKAIKSEPAEVKSESPENKPVNGQSKENSKSTTKDEAKKDDGKVLKIQSAGGGQAGADYNPSKKNYDPIKDAFWNRGDK